jgi:hypothetical protein
MNSLNLIPQLFTPPSQIASALNSKDGASSRAVESGVNPPHSKGLSSHPSSANKRPRLAD